MIYALKFGASLLLPPGIFILIMFGVAGWLWWKNERKPALAIVTVNLLFYLLSTWWIAGMMIGSTQNGSVTYNTANDPTSGLKNISFCGLMPMTNKATEAEYTCNGTNVSYRIAGALRCVRND